MDTKALENPARRQALALRREPYFTTVCTGLSLGYRTVKAGSCTWVARRWTGQKYAFKTLGACDDPGVVAGMSYEAALAEAVQWMGAVDSPRIHSDYTLEQACADYVEDLRVRGKASASTVGGSFRRYLLTHGIRRRTLAELGAPELKRWHKWVSEQRRRQNAKRDVSPEEDLRRRRANANRILSQLKSALNLAYAEGLVEGRPWDRVKAYQGVEVARTFYLGLEDVGRFVAACRPEAFKELVLGALYTGARYGELCRLRREHYLPDAQALFIEHTKTGASRHVPLSGEGAAFFAELVDRRGEGELLFQKEPGREWRRNEQQRPFREAMRRAGLGKGNFHGLRHTFASHAVMRGWSLPVVAAVLGHTSTRMVEKHYGHLAPSHVVQTARALPADYFSS